MRKKFILTTVLISTLLNTNLKVKAIGNSKITLSGENETTVGETYTITLNVSDINNTYDGIVSMGGNLIFDTTKLEYISSKQLNTPYQFQTNKISDGNYKFAGLDMTLDNGIYNNTNIYEFTFKVINEGNTEIKLENIKLTDSQSYIETSITNKNIIINKKQEKIEDIKTTNDKPIIKKELTTKKEKINNNIYKEEIKTEKPNNETLENNIKITETKKEEINNELFIEKTKNLFTNIFSQFKILFK